MRESGFGKIVGIDKLDKKSVTPKGNFNSMVDDGHKNLKEIYTSGRKLPVRKSEKKTHDK